VTERYVRVANLTIFTMLVIFLMHEIGLQIGYQHHHSCHQYITSPTPVTNIDLAVKLLLWVIITKLLVLGSDRRNRISEIRFKSFCKQEFEINHSDGK